MNECGIAGNVGKIESSLCCRFDDVAIRHGDVDGIGQWGVGLQFSGKIAAFEVVTGASGVCYCGYDCCYGGGAYGSYSLIG